MTNLAEQIRANAKALKEADRDNDGDTGEVLEALAEALDGEVGEDPETGKDAVRVYVRGRNGRSIGSLSVRYRNDLIGGSPIEVDGWAGRKLTERHAGHREDLQARARQLCK